MERTLAIIKPDAVSRGLTGKIVSRIEKEGFNIVSMELYRMAKAEAEVFYGVHNGKSFFARLVDFMCSGSSIFLVLEKENAVESWRTLMGATKFEDAEEGTIRKDLGLNDSPERNLVHGSDSAETAIIEMEYFFKANFSSRLRWLSELMWADFIEGGKQV
jgi:nucleoside-diphosphate kinase